MFLSVRPSRTVNLSFGLRPVEVTGVGTERAIGGQDGFASAQRMFIELRRTEVPVHALELFETELSAPKAPLCTPISCTYNLLKAARQA